ncbi:MAG: HD-GYP domain-containing protein [Bacillota bacterium]
MKFFKRGFTNQIAGFIIYAAFLLLCFSYLDQKIGIIFMMLGSIVYGVGSLVCIYKIENNLDKISVTTNGTATSRVIQNTSAIQNGMEALDYNKIELIVDAFENISKLSKNDFIKKVFYSAFELIPEAEKGSFYELNGDRFVPILCKGYDFDILKKLSFTKEEVFIGYECAVKDSIESYEVFVSKRDDTKFSQEIIEVFKSLGTYENFSSIYAPIQIEGEHIGIICLENFNNLGFSSVSKKVLKYYAQLISEFYSQRVFQEKETRVYQDIVTALVSAIEVMDVYTEGHSQRVMKYSCRIAEEMDLAQEQINHISIASLLHDIGKIGIPSEILNKPGKLTEAEYEIVKRHPEYAKKILEKISGFSKVKELTYAHHEHYDGSGYPLALRGDDIPIEAHIIQIADAFDAMTSERSYRKALPIEKANQIIKREMGKQFHPEVARIAIEKVFITNESLQVIT